MTAPECESAPLKIGTSVAVLTDVGFVHLHVHSSYSLLEGSLRIANLLDLAKADHQPALALTDTNNLFGALEFSEKLSGKGIQPIAGLQLSVCFEEPDPNARATPLKPEATVNMRIPASSSRRRPVMSPSRPTLTTRVVTARR